MRTSREITFGPVNALKPLLVLWAVLQVAATCAAQPTALDRYVASPDPAYSFRLAASTPGFGYTTYVLEMTSQTWRTAAEVDRPTWRHWLLVAVPSTVRVSTGLLFINGGSIDDPQPVQVSAELGYAAATTGAVVAELRMVPNQPLTFRDESRTRDEDSLIAYTWDKYLRTGDEQWPAQLPMTKAAVRAMDTVTAFCRTPAAGANTVDKFVVVGASKRGWATWTTAAVDQRVVAIIPMVIDTLNLERTFLHHWQAYGFWAPAVSEYEQIGVMSWFGTTQMRSLAAIIDPYTYRARYTMPKYIVNAAGDEFFLPDSSRFYFDDLPGQKYLRYVPNSGHSLDNPDVLPSCLAFFQYVIAGTTLPRFSWEFLTDGGIRLRVVDRPSEVRLWQATNRNARDFRVESIGKTWAGSALAESSPGVYEARVTPPAQGWSAFFLELTYSAGLIPLKFTTPVRVAPDTLPFPPPLGAVSAASYIPLTAPDSIVSAYGEGLSAATASAADSPLPESLARVSVRLTDSKGGVKLAPLFFVSPLQVYYLTPPGAAAGLAQVEVIREGQVVIRGQTLIEDFAPAIFTANVDGRGVAAAMAVTVKADGSQVIQLIFDPSAPPGSRTGVPIDLGAAGDRVYLSLFGTGMRHAAGPATATVGGETVGVTGPIPLSQTAGLDQVDLGPLPASLAGKGEVNVVLTVAGKRANVVTVTFR